MQRTSRRQWSRNAGKAGIALLGLIVTAYFISLYLDTIVTRDRLVVLVRENPASFDPTDFDFFHLQPFQAISNAKLFSNFQDAKLKPQLVKSWRSEKSATEWYFEIRDDVFFDKGRKLTVEDVQRSLQRIAFLAREKNSRNGFVENLENFSRLKAAFDPTFSGISIVESKLRIKLIKPVENLPELLGFGLYGIVDPKYFDPKTGKWAGAEDGYKGSGPYSFVGRENGNAIFELKENYPADLRHSGAFRRIAFISDRANASRADLFVGNSTEYGYESTHSFRSGGSNGIYFFLVHPWKLKTSPLSDLGARCELRRKLNDSLKGERFDPPRSFFPLVLPGVGAIVQETPRNYAGEKKREVSFIDFRPMSTPLKQAAVDSIEKAIASMGFMPRSVKNATIEQSRENKDYDRAQFDFDLAFYITDISIIDPKQDVRLMFSKEGLDLPDLTGEIRKELKKDSFSIQRVNEELIKQCIVFPVAHVEHGLWVKDGIDFSRYNTMLLLGELQWLSTK